jgi:hypothetical protein
MVMCGGTADFLELRDDRTDKLLARYYPADSTLEIRRGVHVARVQLVNLLRPEPRPKGDI